MTELELVVENSPRLSENTKRNYLRCIRAFLDFAGTYPENWSGAVVENWRDVLSKGRKAQTVNSYLAALRYASRRLAHRHQNPQLDFAGYAEMLPVRSRRAPRALTLEEGRALLHACEGPAPIDRRDLAIVTLGLRTGLRRQGICSIRMSDFKGPVVRVVLKGGRDHYIALDQDVTSAIGAWTRWLFDQNVRDGFLFRALSKPKIDGSVRIGEKLTADGLYRAMKTRAERAGIQDFHPHMFRHTFVSWCQQAGIPAYRIAGVTGHKSTGMIDTYTTDLDPTPVGDALPSMKKK